MSETRKNIHEKIIMARHIILQEASSKRTYELDLPCVVGRGEQADLSFSDSAISHRHALIFEMDGEIWIEDLKSANGIYVNGQKIEEKNLLKPGDSIRLGRTEFLVSQAEEEVSQQTVILHALDPKAEWRLDRQKLRLIYELTTELSENQDLTDFGYKIFARFKEIFQQDRGYVALFLEDGSLEPIFLDPSLTSLPISRTIVNRLFQSGESFLLEDALSETSLKEQESIIALRIRSALCVPLIYHDQIYGLIYLDRYIPGVYKQDDLEFLRTIAFILAPLIENARLWSELKNHYTRATETLKKTEARLIDTERTAAYVRLAQAMAHEIRNPLMTIGGLVRRLAKVGSEGLSIARLQAIITSVEKMETVLKEMDNFVELPPPHKNLRKIDCLIQEEIENHGCEWQKNRLRPLVSIHTPHLMVPLDPDLFRKALSIIFKELLLSVPQGSDLKISIQDFGSELEILIGEIDKDRRFCELFDPELQRRPWSLGLFLNIAHKIISDHGGKLLLDPQGRSAFPLIIRMPRTIEVQTEYMA
jgi:pSer/pThr/pTyr-binding forkhead associated (FHA) protein